MSIKLLVKLKCVEVSQQIFKTAVPCLPCNIIFKPTEQQFGAGDALQHANNFAELRAMTAKCCSLRTKMTASFSATEFQRHAAKSQADNEMVDINGQLVVACDKDFYKASQGSGYSSMFDSLQACQKKTVGFAPFRGKQESLIKLLLHVRHTKARPDTYKSLMRWHPETIALLCPRERLSKSLDFISSEKLCEELKLQYPNLPTIGYT